MVKNLRLKYFSSVLLLITVTVIPLAEANGGRPVDDKKEIKQSSNNSTLKEEQTMNNNHTESEDPMHSFHFKISKIFDDINRDSTFFIPSSMYGFSHSMKSRIDITSDDKSYNVRVEVPGMDEKNLTIKIIDHSLIIEGKNETEKNQKNNESELDKSSHASFQQILSLPKNADEDNISAKIKNGLLTIKIFKKELIEEKAKVIQIIKE